MLRRILTSLAVVAAIATIAHAAQLRLSLAEISQAADLIFVGTVESQTSRYNDAGTAIQTDVVFRDIREVHGTDRSRQRGAATITLSYAGGTVGNVTMEASEAPRFTTGSRYLVFMNDDGPTYLNPLVGGEQGLFEIVGDSSGSAYVLTSDRRAVLNVGSDGRLQASRGRIQAIDGGVLSPVAEAPVAAPQAELAPESITPGALAEPAVEPSRALADDTPMTMDAFIQTVTGVMLTMPVRSPRLKRGTQGEFLREIGGAVVAEPLKLSLPPVRSLAAMEARVAPIIPEGVLGLTLPPTLGGRELPDVSGQSLFYCGTRSRPFTMEQVPTSWWEWDQNNNSMWMWNQWVDLFRYVADDGTFGNNDENEFAGYPAGSFHGFAWNGSLAMTVTWTSSGQCGTITQSDIAWNPAYSWTNSFSVAFNGTAINQLPVTGHELGHAHGLQRGGEQYNYDYVSIMHAYYDDVVEDGWGIHSSDGINTRGNYGSNTGIVDMGVESYWASNGLNNSTTNLLVYRPGDTITVNSLTVENTSQLAASNAHVRLYLSTDQNITTGDRLLGDWSWGSFCGNCQYVGNYSAWIPSNTPPGTYWVGAIMSINGFGADGFSGNDRTFLATQITVTCSGTYSVSPTSRAFLRGGAASLLAVNSSGSACGWNATVSDASWIQITGGGSGTGNGTTSYTVAANFGAARNGWIRAGGATHTITQEAGCVAGTPLPLATWGSAAGALTASDCLAQFRSLPGNTRPYADRYSFSGEAGEQVALWLTSSTVNTYISLISPTGTLLTQDDDGGGGASSRLPSLSGLYTLPTTGVYLVEVTSSSAGATGAYTLTKMGSIRLTVSPDPVTGSCKLAKGSVKLGAAAPVGGLVLSLSDTLANASLPASLVIPAGSTAKSFDIASTAVAANQTGNVMAAWGGAYGVSGADSLTLRPISVASLTLSPNPVKGGRSAFGLVTLECAAGPGNVTVTLSTNKATLAAPAVSSIVIPAGTATGGFDVSTFRPTTQSSAKIKATANGRAKSATLTVTP